MTPSNPNVVVNRDVIDSTALPLSSVGQTAQSQATRAAAIRMAPPIAPTQTVSPMNTNAPEHKDSLAVLPAEQPSESNPGDLLRQANRARSLGQIDRAIVLFTELQDEFPRSAEAHVSLVSLGKLLMQRAMPAAALLRFSSYLATAGPLEEEALLGRAQALGALGRSADESRTWERLLSRFPGSVYAGAARKRLVALGGTSAQ
jgi:TolA-binding protein